MIGENENLEVDEKVVLQKFEGDPLPENEFERVTIQNGVVVSVDKVENGEVVGPAEDSEVNVGAEVGTLFPQNNNTEGEEV